MRVGDELKIRSVARTTNDIDIDGLYVTIVGIDNPVLDNSPWKVVVTDAHTPGEEPLFDKWGWVSLKDIIAWRRPQSTKK